MADLLKEAIADAKAVRQTAIANAKLALEEAFTPKLQSMLAAKINEQDELDVEDEEEVVDGDVAMDSEASPELDAAIDDAESMEVDDEEASEDDGGEDLELESIIRELEDDGEEDDEEEEVMEGSIESSSKIGNGTSFDDNSGATPDPSGKETGANGDKAITGSDLLEQLEDGEEDEDDEDEDVSIDEVLRSLREQDDLESEDEEEEDETADAVAEARYVAHAYENKLREAYGALAFMKNKINEVNLLNAKLLFSNKLFRAGNLNENQKLRVIETFDRANNLREIKLVYSTLAESFKGGSRSKSVSKRPITEGMASRPTASTKPRNVITEGQIQAARFQKLAGLIK
tara:strand:+ start:1592 stop:2629 length:1038 start_codon:yes stop_codon:yes gene_type:complete